MTAVSQMVAHIAAVPAVPPSGAQRCHSGAMFALVAFGPPGRRALGRHPRGHPEAPSRHHRPRAAAGKVRFRFATGRGSLVHELAKTFTAPASTEERFGGDDQLSADTAGETYTLRATPLERGVAGGAWRPPSPSGPVR